MSLGTGANGFLDRVFQVRVLPGVPRTGPKNPPPDSKSESEITNMPALKWPCAGSIANHLIRTSRTEFRGSAQAPRATASAPWTKEAFVEARPRVDLR